MASQSQQTTPIVSLPVVGVIIVNYRTPELTCKCLASLATIRNDTFKGIRVVVVDNCSGDDSVARITAFAKTVKGVCLSVTVLQSASNLGFGYGCNYGVAKLTDFYTDVKYLWFLNSDADAQPDTLDRLMEGVLLHGDAIYGSVTGNTNHSYLRRFYRAIGACKKIPNQLANGLTIEQQFVTGASLLLPTQLFFDLHGYDESLFLYWEDTDLCFRYRQQMGGKVYVCRKSFIGHAEGASVGQLTPYRFYLDYYNCARFYRRNLPAWIPIVIFGRMIFTSYLLAKFRFSKKICRIMWQCQAMFLRGLFSQQTIPTEFIGRA